MTNMEGVYQKWLDLYDEGKPEEALALAAPDFVMLAPDGRKLNRDEALVMTKGLKAQIERAALSRKSTALLVHTAQLGEMLCVYAHVELVLKKGDAEVMRRRFVEVMHIGPQGIGFDAFAILADSQKM